MKKLIVSYFLITGLLLTSCGPRVATTINNTYTPIAYDDEVTIIQQGSSRPENAEVLGTVKVGDNGFTARCTYKDVITEAKMEARKAGGNALHITRHHSPDLLSTCHRITAKILKVKE